MSEIRFAVNTKARIYFAYFKGVPMRATADRSKMDQMPHACPWILTVTPIVMNCVERNFTPALREPREEYGEICSHIA